MNRQYLFFSGEKKGHIVYVTCDMVNIRFQFFGRSPVMVKRRECEALPGQKDIRCIKRMTGGKSFRYKFENIFDTEKKMTFPEYIGYVRLQEILLGCSTKYSDAKPVGFLRDPIYNVHEYRDFHKGVDGRQNIGFYRQHIIK
jgi:hypothetical protein